MEELEFSQRIVKVLNSKTLQDTLRKAETQGFTVPGFAKNVSQAPQPILESAMKMKKRGRNFQSGIFIKCLAELDTDIPESKIARKWLEGGVSRSEAESELINIETRISEKRRQIENDKKVLDLVKIDDDVQEDILKEKTEIIKKQKERIKKLQGIIQGYKISDDNYKKEIEQLKRENNKLETQNIERIKSKAGMEDTIKKLKIEISEQQQQLEEMRGKIKEYKNILENSPRILCFSKKQINKDIFPFYNIKWLDEWKQEYVKIIDWTKYYEIWIVESDFSYSEVKSIKGMAKGKVITARNISMLITKIGGNN